MSVLAWFWEISDRLFYWDELNILDKKNHKTLFTDEIPMMLIRKHMRIQVEIKPWKLIYSSRFKEKWTRRSKDIFDIIIIES